MASVLEVSSAPEQEAKTSAAAEESGYRPDPSAASDVNFSGADIALRVFLFAISLAGLIDLLTSKQTQLVPTGLPAPFPPLASVAAKFQHSPALIYDVAALAVTSFYAAITTAASVASAKSPSTRVLFYLIVTDLLMAGIMSSATGTAGAVSYIGLRGDDHVRWNKICDVYGEFCRHVGSAAFLSLGASIALVVLTVVSTYSLYRRSR